MSKFWKNWIKWHLFMLIVQYLNSFVRFGILVDTAAISYINKAHEQLADANIQLHGSNTTIIKFNIYYDAYVYGFKKAIEITIDWLPYCPLYPFYFLFEAPLHVFVFFSYWLVVVYTIIEDRLDEEIEKFKSRMFKLINLFFTLLQLLRVALIAIPLKKRVKDLFSTSINLNRKHSLNKKRKKEFLWFFNNIEYSKDLLKAHFVFFCVIFFIWLKEYVLAVRKLISLDYFITTRNSRETWEVVDGVLATTWIEGKEPTKWEYIVFIYNNAGPIWQEKFMLYFYDSLLHNENVASHLMHRYLFFLFLVCAYTELRLNLSNPTPQGVFFFLLDLVLDFVNFVLELITESVLEFIEEVYFLWYLFKSMEPWEQLISIWIITCILFVLYIIIS